MKAITKIEQCLAQALASADDPNCPPKLAGAVRHAVFPGGARVRPQLALAVAQACGMDDPRLSESVAVAIELMHCASLVHDDLPCFDDAQTRRGRASVHYAYGEHRRCTDRVGLSNFGDRGHPITASLASFNPNLGLLCGHARGHRGRSSLGIRVTCFPHAIPARQNRCPVCGRYQCRRIERRRRPQAMARFGRLFG